MLSIYTSCRYSVRFFRNFSADSVKDADGSADDRVCQPPSLLYTHDRTLPHKRGNLRPAERYNHEHSQQHSHASLTNCHIVDTSSIGMDTHNVLTVSDTDQQCKVKQLLRRPNLLDGKHWQKPDTKPCCGWKSLNDIPIQCKDTCSQGSDAITGQPNVPVSCEINLTVVHKLVDCSKFIPSSESTSPENRGGVSSLICMRRSYSAPPAVQRITKPIAGSSGEVSSLSTVRDTTDGLVSCNVKHRRDGCLDTTLCVFPALSLTAKAQARSVQPMTASSSSRTPSPRSECCVDRSCSQEARLDESDINVNELAAYVDNFLHLPKEMSLMAEMMYI